MTTLCSLLYVESADAQLTDAIRQMRTTTFEWNIKLVDQYGKAIPAGTLWLLEVDEARLRNVATMERMARRYAADADFIQFGGEPGPFVTHRTSRDGGLTESKDCICDTKEITYVYAAFKRGYKSKVVSSTARRNSKVDVTIALDIDPDAKVDPRMLQMDWLRARAHSPAQSARSIMQGDVLLTDREVNREMLSLAESLEMDQPELASAVYHSLAYLPYVKTIPGPDGGERIVGYANSGTDTPQSKAVLKKAYELNQSMPTWLLRKARSAVRERYTSRPGPPTPQEWTEMNRLTEAYIEKYGERLWPRDYSHLTYKMAGMWTQACMAIKRYRKFEPTEHNSDSRSFSWDSEMKYLNLDARKAGYTGPNCSFLE